MKELEQAFGFEPFPGVPLRWCTQCLGLYEKKKVAVAVLTDWDGVARFGCEICTRSHCAFIEQTRTDQRQLSMGKLHVESLKSFFDRATAANAEEALMKMRDP